MYILTIDNTNRIKCTRVRRERATDAGNAGKGTDQSGSQPKTTTPKERRTKEMQNYKITVDGFTVGIIELTANEAQELEKDNGITVERI